MSFLLNQEQQRIQQQTINAIVKVEDKIADTYLSFFLNSVEFFYLSNVQNVTWTSWFRLLSLLLFSVSEFTAKVLSKLYEMVNCLLLSSRGLQHICIPIAWPIILFQNIFAIQF